MFVAGFLALVIAAALFLVIERPRERPLHPRTVASFDVTAPNASSEPQAPKEIFVEAPEPIVVPPIAIELPSENLMLASMVAREGEDTGGSCDMTPAVQDALRADPRVAELMPTVAEERRSVANALAVWNRVWVEPDRRFPEPALAAIRDTVREAVERASDACRFQELGGPRLLYLPIDGSTVVLAMGSGRWTWEQVAESADPEFLLEQSIAAAPGSDGVAQPSEARQTLLERLFDS